MIETRDDTSKLLDIKIFSCFIIKLYTEYFLGICKEFICKCPKVVCTCGWRLYKSTILKLGGWNFVCGLYSSWVRAWGYEAGLRGHWGRGLLKVWDVLHGTLRWASEANGPFEAGLCDLRGQVHIMKADCEYPNNPQKFSPEAWFYGGTIVNIPPQPIIHT